jgi:uncharacterized protein YuzE
VPASIRIGPYDFDHIAHDEEGDVLYLSVGEPREAADSQETPEGHVVRYDNDEHIIGVSIVNARWIFDLDQAVAVTLTGRSAPGLGRPVQIEPTALLAETFYPTPAIPEEWKVSDNGQAAQNWVAAIHRSRATSRDDDH